MYICVYVCCCLIGSWLFYSNDYIYVCMYVPMSLYDRDFKGHSCGGMIAYAGELLGEVLGLMRNQVGGVTLTYLWDRYHVDMNWYYMLVLCLCLSYGHVM